MMIYTSLQLLYSKCSKFHEKPQLLLCCTITAFNDQQYRNPSENIVRKEEMLVTSIFSFFPHCFALFQKQILICQSHSFYCLQMFIIWDSQKFCCLIYVGKQTVAWKEYCARYWLKGPQTCMDKYPDGCNITEIRLKMA